MGRARRPLDEYRRHVVDTSVGTSSSYLMLITVKHPQLDLSQGESDEVRRLAASLVQHDSTDDPNLVAKLQCVAHELPARLRNFVINFKSTEPASFCVVRGLRLDDTSIGPTPRHWRERSVPNPALAEEIVCLLYAALVGEPFAWSTQQDGRLVHDVFPIAEHRQDQLGFGSEVTLTWHTEDAFHPYRGDYLVLGCLRNPDNVPTTVGSLDANKLRTAVKDVLFQERFIIRPDESHLARNNTTPDAGGTFTQIDHMLTQPQTVALLFGDRQDPYLRLDPYFMEVPVDDFEAREALRAVVEVIDHDMQDLVLTPGDVVIIDNFRAVHGRSSFRPRFDGTDRWLKRVNVTRDLRKSRAARDSPSSWTVR